MKGFSFVVASLFVAAVGCGGAATSGDASARAGSSSGGSSGEGGGSSSGTSGISGSSGDAAGGSSAQGGSSGGSGAGVGGAELCGMTTCSANQYCVVPCCGGPAPLCFDPPDGGACPDGSTQGCFSGASYACASVATCCQPVACTPPLPYCSDTLPSGGCSLQGRTCRLECA